MLLIDLSARLAGGIAEVETAQGLAHQRKAIASRATQLENALNRLKAANGRAAALRARGIPVDASVGSAAGARSFLSDWYSRVATKPDEALGTGDHAFKARALDVIENLATGLTQAVGNAWKRHALATLPRVDDSLIRLLENLPGGQAASVRAFRDLYKRAVQMAATPPSDEQGFSDFADLAEQCRTGWARIDAQGCPPEIQLFLREAGAPGGAGLALLTPDVLGWLESHGLADHYRVRAQ